MKLDFNGRTVLITGHTGFKGAWMSMLLKCLGANVVGYALPPLKSAPLFDLCGIESYIKSIYGDIRDLEKLKTVFAEYEPEIVIHMAAQALVGEGYQQPVVTYDVNVMGTVNILECVRLYGCVKSFVNVTTDKVYVNREWDWGYRENEELNGYDPYSNSKSCSELVTDCYRKSFFEGRDIAISTARAGNVIGGGDFSKGRILSDCVAAANKKKNIIVKNPYSIRPYQHVLEPIAGYLLLAQEQYKNNDLSGCYNIGPDEKDCIETGKLVSIFCEKWNKATNENIIWSVGEKNAFHEAKYLKLDCSKIKKMLKWQPRWNIETAVEKAVEWYIPYLRGENIAEIMEKQIADFLVSEN